MPKPHRFIVFHIRSTMADKSFYFEHHALAHANKLNARNARYYPDQPQPHYAYASIDHYRTNVVHMVTRRNLISGLEYQEPSNTPGYMSPASEAYWSM